MREVGHSHQIHFGATTRVAAGDSAQIFLFDEEFLFEHGGFEQIPCATTKFVEPVVGLRDSQARGLAARFVFNGDVVSRRRFDIPLDFEFKFAPIQSATEIIFFSGTRVEVGEAGEMFLREGARFGFGELGEF